MADVNKCTHNDTQFPCDDSGEQMTMKAVGAIAQTEVVIHYITATGTTYIYGKKCLVGSIGADQGSATYNFDDAEWKVAGIAPSAIAGGAEGAVTIHGVVDTDFNANVANTTKVYIMLGAAGAAGDAAATSTATGNGTIFGVSLEKTDPGLIFLFPWRI